MERNPSFSWIQHDLTYSTLHLVVKLNVDLHLGQEALFWVRYAQNVFGLEDPLHPSPPLLDNVGLLTPTLPTNIRRMCGRTIAPAPRGRIGQHVHPGLPGV